MDWTTIIVGLLSGTSIGGIFEAIRYRNLNKRDRAAEVNKSENEEQSQRIDLAEKYQEKVYELCEKTYQATLKNNTDIHQKVDEVSQKCDGIHSEMANVVKYLNGDYQKFLAEQAKA